MMGWLIFWAVFIGYWAVAARLAPRYYRIVRDYHREQWPSLHSEDADSERHYREYAAWAMPLLAVWPFYELYRLAAKSIVDAASSDERKAKELAEARRVIAEYEREQLRRNP